MPLSKHTTSKRRRTPFITPEVNSSTAGVSSASNGKQTGRKASLAVSLQSFANRTFQSLPRRVNTGSDNADATAAPKLRHSSAKLLISRPVSKLPIPQSRPSTSSSIVRIPPSGSNVPPVPPLPARGSESRIPTSSRIPAPTARQLELEPRAANSDSKADTCANSRTSGYNHFSPQPKPFVAYEDVKALTRNKASPKDKQQGLETLKVKDSKSERDTITGKPANSTPFRKRMISFSHRRTSATASGKSIRASDMGIPKSTSMTAITSSRRASEIPPVCSFHSLHAPPSSQVKSPSTCGLNIGANPGQTPDRATSHTHRTLSNASGATSLTCSPRERDLPLPPIPSLPKSYSVGNVRIDGQTEKTPLPVSYQTPASPRTPEDTRAHMSSMSTLGHTHDAPKPKDSKRSSRPSDAVLNCYVTAKYSTVSAHITEPLLDLTPPRPTHSPAHVCLRSASPRTLPVKACKRTEENVNLVRASAHDITPSKKILKLTVKFYQVTRAQPQQYWLGRLSTLVNSLQYEDAFNEPDPYITYRAPSRTKILKTCGIESAEEFNIKRAFAALERACMTDEATKSLNEFKEEYERKYTKSGTPKPDKGSRTGMRGRQTAIRMKMNTEEKD
uniref:Uncharacterized protein n=1 Tax=Coccidioides posadasii RMSCC 3488 TaxID=454284 RepID=A0A0J6FIL9_COCPO|nr:hypothetical protein CPAG_05003 [Coccidioides posadasii RMSCC 3488]